MVISGNQSRRKCYSYTKFDQFNKLAAWMGVFVWPPLAEVLLQIYPSSSPSSSFSSSSSNFLYILLVSFLLLCFFSFISCPLTSSRSVSPASTMHFDSHRLFTSKWFSSSLFLAFFSNFIFALLYIQQPVQHYCYFDWIFWGVLLSSLKGPPWISPFLLI